MNPHALSALIDEIIISKPYRNRGIGKKLIEAVIKECKKIGCCEIEVSTEKSNINAKNFYKSLGFAEKGVLFEIDL
ncbi:GNAT family N-acetyltransferase [Thermosipho ferrireducens]|uniref:GNAT family N-acetyltransferase n=1 Tax=Thermosipho ferrireducens TaxID=2571116 RepID=A0ABX7S8H0_9BACT|nr:GNAT family N-acetyltransferase [Thermosipho ferrireducens]